MTDFSNNTRASRGCARLVRCSHNRKKASDGRALVVVDSDEEGQVLVDKLNFIAEDLQSELKDSGSDACVLAAVVFDEGCRQSRSVRDL